LPACGAHVFLRTLFAHLQRNQEGAA
jgi:hypothetical protein